MAPRISFHKIVISGHIVEAFQYKNPIGYNLEASRAKAEFRKRRSIEDQEITKSSLSRTKNTLIHLINANSRMWQNEGEIIQPQFLTYTFHENVTDITTANHIFTNYIKRRNYHVFGAGSSTLKYVVVPEFQERGAVHYHAVYFNLPLINTRHEFKTGQYASLWRQGFIKKKNITSVANVGRYMTKYMTKDAGDRRLVGKKKYFSSRGLIKPVIITHQHLAEEITTYLSEFKAIHAYITQPSEENQYSPENPTFCATYNLNPEQLSGLRSFYNLNV